MTTTMYPRAGRAPKPATDKQLGFLNKLMAERELPQEFLDRVEELKQTDALTVAKASTVIDLFLQYPYKGGAAKVASGPDSGLDLSDLPSGRYAVPGGDTRLKIKIDNLTGEKHQGTKWAGWVFVKDAAVYGEGQRYGSQRPGQTYRGKVEDALRAIVADPEAAMKRYGELTSTCGNCGLPLEDEESVARGIGPVCAKNLGWL